MIGRVDAGKPRLRDLRELPGRGVPRAPRGGKPGQLTPSLTLCHPSQPHRWASQAPTPAGSQIRLRVRPEATGSGLCLGPTGENVKAFFSRVAALAFEQSVLQDLERRSSARLQVGDGDLIRAYRQQGRGWGAGLQLKTRVHQPPVPRGHSLNLSSCAGLSGVPFLSLL